jgi:broad-specificity NMP kinase
VAAEILLLAGLPGCGKTTYVKDLRLDGWSDFDDFKSEAVDNSPSFCKSKKLSPARSS